MPRGMAVKIGGRVLYLGGHKIAYASKVHSVKRKMVACGGFVRQVWPPSDNLPPPDSPLEPNELVDLRAEARERSPTDAVAILRYENATGRLIVSKYNGGTSYRLFDRPPQPGEVLLRASFDPADGIEAVDYNGAAKPGTDSWFDPALAGAGVIWQLTNASNDASVITGQLVLEASQQDGSGSPAGKDVSIDCDYIAEVFGTDPNNPDGTLTLTADPWTLRHITTDEPAFVSISANYAPYINKGTLSGKEAGQTRLTEEYANPANRSERVTVSGVSGDFADLIGDPLDTSLPLDFVNATSASWELRADVPGESKQAVVDVTFTDGAGDTAVKRVTLIAQQDTAGVPPSTLQSFPGGGVNSTPISGNGKAALAIRGPQRFANLGGGEIDLFNETGQSAYTWPKPWLDSAPNPPDAERFETRLLVISGTGPNGNGNPPVNTWLDMDIDYVWELVVRRGVAGEPVGRSAVWELQIQVKNQPGTRKTARYNMTVVLEGGQGPGDDNGPAPPNDPQPPPITP